MLEQSFFVVYGADDAASIMEVDREDSNEQRASRPNLAVRIRAAVFDLMLG